MYESLWPLFMIIIVYFVFLGFFIAMREQTFLDEKVLLSWMISAFGAALYFDIVILSIVTIEIIAFLATFIIVYGISEERDYAIVYGLLVALILLSLVGFLIELYPLSYICIGIILFIITILLNDYYRD